MKDKIKVMNKQQGITDEELDRFKNFDALLAKYNKTTPVTFWVKVSTGIVSVLIVSGAIYYFNSQPELAVKKTPIAVPDNKSEQSEPMVRVDTLEETDRTKENLSRRRPIESTENQLEMTTQETQTEIVPPLYVQAEPVKGYANLYEYFNRELVYPPAAVLDSIQGVLTVSFTINKQGVAQNFQFTNSLGRLFEEEAIRLIQQMPAWKPATVNGTPVSSRMSLPLTFQIQKQKN